MDERIKQKLEKTKYKITKRIRKREEEKRGK